MMKDKRASHTTREKDSSYKQNKDTGRNEKRPKSMQAKRRNPAQHRGERKHDIDTSLVTYGRNSVMEFLRAGKVRQIYLKSGRHDERLQEILEEAKSRAVPIKEVEEEELDSMSGGVVHQGIAALLFPYEYQDMNAVIKKWEGKDPIFILLDGVEDVRNLGAIVRTAECAGAACVLLPNHKSSPVTAAAMKTAAGAFAYLPVCRIGNIQQTLKYLKEKGFWVVGTDMDGESLYYEANLKGPLVIVMGAEGKGMSPLTRRMCDFCVRIPMKGKVSSLNVSVAAALLLYEAVKQRN
ncbi:23S rRNA (guanosine(2251)-2'-O)-methyltransferase RlmB [Dialister hominis]|jgi:23S rRNA (guanosine2251-2'-O)-methyltransferase|nr:MULTISPECIES: 23S rRNA (guanosine(2251)-2'-O)-methyltransferase RlmB [environmental samples]MCH3912568.1 23S rRNA (guanosine(2251)-2'-O)-methyltransferase RlmB [Dialister sp.]MEE1350307.1 23S rRNA (guanosine(2251)-2'-O)-methyltransferase RlmB [Dialister hominis]HJI43011.1 23S rRNA (guanosine(2251)-2'-O)-methyltransferase RlmB [Veillonellaceae bacterium]